MDFKEIQKKKESELHKALAESRDQLRDMRFKVASKQLKDISSIKKIKKTIANILTVLNGKPASGGKEAVKTAEEKK